MSKALLRPLPALAAALFVALPALALDVGSDGSDGTLNPASGTTTINLGLAANGSWTDPGNGNGVYDPQMWAVVFKYSSVNIQSGRTIQFTNHPSGAPVVWLVQGNVAIAGGIDLDGDSCTSTGGANSVPGPGGFRGGGGTTGNAAGAGLGPGGGMISSVNAAYAGGTTALRYGNARVLPLIGGSGGAGSSGSSYSGGAGGGAILIAANGTITVSGGYIHARGGQCGVSGAGHGSGGAIRLIANTITGYADELYAQSLGSGGTGRIRIEANTINLTGGSNPGYTALTPLEDDTAVIWPPTGSPSVRVVSIDGRDVPPDPRAQFITPGDVPLDTSSAPTVVVEALNMPLTWTVTVRVNPRSGTEYSVPATLVGGDEVMSTWTASLSALPSNNFVVIQARAKQP